MSIVPSMILDSRRVAAPAEVTSEEPASDATFGMALMLAVAAQGPQAPVVPVPMLDGLGFLSSGEPAEGGVEAPLGRATAPLGRATALLGHAAALHGHATALLGRAEAPLGRAAAPPAGSGAPTRSAAATLLADLLPIAVPAPSASSSVLVTAIPGQAPPVQGAGLSGALVDTAIPTPPIQLPAVPDPAGRGAPANPAVEPVAATVVAGTPSVAPGGLSVSVLAASAGSSPAPRAGSAAFESGVPDTLLEPAAARPDGLAAPPRPTLGSSTNPGGGDASRQGAPTPRRGGETPAPVVAPAAPPAIALAAPPPPAPATVSAPSGVAAVDPLPPALLDAESTAVPQTPGRVTLTFSGEGGLEGRLRVALRGSELRATIVSPPGALHGIESGLGDLRRALIDRGFPNVQLTVQPGPVSDGEASSPRRSENGSEGRGDSRSRTQDEHAPGEQRPRGRDPRRPPER